MTEQDSIRRAEHAFASVDSLARDLTVLGVVPRTVLLVHASLGALGWVAGGAQAVVLALEQALTAGGTLVMPTMSTQLTDPARWEKPPVPRAWWDGVRASLPAYDPALTPTREMGAIPECFRKQTGVVRSAHPHTSFAAWGPRAHAIVDGHALASRLGEGSPLARLYALDAHVLLLGVGHARNTSLRLAEHRAAYPGKRAARYGAPLRVDGQRAWVEFEDLDTDDSDFPRIGADFESGTGAVRHGHVARAAARLMPQRALVDFAVDWIERHRH